MSVSAFVTGVEASNTKITIPAIPSLQLRALAVLNGALVHVELKLVRSWVVTDVRGRGCLQYPTFLQDIGSSSLRTEFQWINPRNLIITD